MDQIAQDTHLETETETETEKPDEPIIDSLEDSGAVRPENIPEKFWDEDQGCIRTDALLKSYLELEHRFSSDFSPIPETPADYELTMPGEYIEQDDEVDTLLHAAGFTQEQAQLVYDLAHEKLAPVIAGVSNELLQQASLTQLEVHFGGREKWQQISSQIKNWGKSKLPKDAYETLSTSVEGVKVMHQMMKSNEPSLVGNPSSSPGARSESDLKRMMRDPRYWRDQDPAYIEEIQKGFQALYPE